MTPIKTISLALQGGGSHGAYTWGVLDRLLEDDSRLKIEGISGTSAGAMNGAAFLQGYMKGGAEGARQALTQFWHAVSKLGSIEVPPQNLMTEMLGAWNNESNPWASMGMGVTDAMQRLFSPYQINPFNINPLRDLLGDLFDITAIRSCDAVKFFVSATDVETGRVRIFDRTELSVDVLMASACLPFTFHAVEIEGKPYWDGGYVGNPSIFPLIYNCQTPDVVIVQINPLMRPGTPDTSAEIINRLNEITFNASLIAEMRAIAFVQKLIDDDHLKGDQSTRLKRMNMHVIGAENEISSFGASSKTNVHLDFLLRLKELGRQSASAWLNQNWTAIGDHSSVDIRKKYL